MYTQYIVHRTYCGTIYNYIVQGTMYIVHSTYVYIVVGGAHLFFAPGAQALWGSNFVPPYKVQGYIVPVYTIELVIARQLAHYS